MPDLQHPAYLDLFPTGELKKRANTTAKIIRHCSLCPWNCGVNRQIGEKGQCQTGNKARVYSYAAHFGEEKPISGNNGSGTIFFSGCNMHCVYCQNSDISQDMYGLEVSDERLAEMMLELQSQGCHNINLVSPTHVAANILNALLIAIPSGFNLPLVYNSGGYDAVRTISLLENIIDIYMPDMKYADAAKAEFYSGVKDYPTHNKLSIQEMYRQVGDLVLDASGIAKKGLLIRHLILPEDIGGTKRLLEYIADEISIDSYINLMDQYRPAFCANRHTALSRRITKSEYKASIAAAEKLGFHRMDHQL